MNFRDGPPDFSPLDRNRPILKHRRKLPHWTQEGATYFITFRLADSLPAEKRHELERFREEWLQKHSASDEECWRELDRETMRRVEAWLDAGSGECWLRDRACTDVVSRALHHFHEKRHFLSSYCIMPNHVHVLVRPFEGFDPAGLLHSWKSFTANEINRLLGRNGEVWEAESYDTLVRDCEHLRKVIRYIGKNPAKAGLPEAQWMRYVHPEWEAAGWGFETEVRHPG
ncbi:transposase [Prosthecobacter sp.]|uniref:transposase n=1 Tax=Prosthecobacter sp. TaxID=1965333 RepID=UPI003784F4C3